MLVIVLKPAGYYISRNSCSSYYYKTSMKVTFIIASSKRLYYTKMLILKEKQVLSFHLEEILEAFKLANRDRQHILLNENRTANVVNHHEDLH